MDGQRTADWRDYGVTLIIFAINIVGYILCTQMGEIVYNIGSMNAEKILVERQYYRFVTSMFLHADIEHIVSNMIFLIGLGQMVEQAVGHIRFLILYLLSGFGACAFSMVYAVLTGDIYDAVGASGAIFGLIGALFILVIIRDMKRRTQDQTSNTSIYTTSEQADILDENDRKIPSAYESISVGRLVFATVYMIYSGARAARVDNAAHVGGLVCGLLIMAIMNLVRTGGIKR